MQVGPGTTEIAPYRIDAKVKNNRLWRAVLARWPDVRNQSDAGRRLNLGASEFGDLLNMRIFPGHVRDGRIVYSKRAMKVAEALASDVDYLFDHKLYGGKVPGRLVVEVGLAVLRGRHALALPPTPEEEAIQHNIRDLVYQSLASLTPREQLIVERSFGLNDSEEHSLEEIGAELGISIERVRQLRNRALKYLRHSEDACGRRRYSGIDQGRRVGVAGS